MEKCELYAGQLSRSTLRLRSGRMRTLQQLIGILSSFVPQDFHRTSTICSKVPCSVAFLVTVSLVAMERSYKDVVVAEPSEPAGLQGKRELSKQGTAAVCACLSQQNGFCA